MASRGLLEFIGVLASAQGVGAIAGGLPAARFIRNVGEFAAVAIGLAVVGLGTGLLALPWLPAVVTGIAIGGFGLAIVIIGSTTVIQRRTPQPLIGRVSTATEMLVSGPQTISLAAGAALISIVDYRLLLAVDDTPVTSGNSYTTFV